MDSSQLEAYLPLVLLVVVGYLLLIRPARRRAQATAALQSSLAIGDEVMTASGLFGTVVDMQQEVVHMEISPGTIVRVHRGAVTQIVKDQPTPDESDDDAPDSAGRPGDDDAGVS